MFADMSAEQQRAALDAALEQYQEFKAKGLKLNMARGKPGAEQIDLSREMLINIPVDDPGIAEDGTDIFNYGNLEGLPEARALMAAMLDDDADNVIVCGNASLNIMYDMVMRCYVFGTQGNTPWGELGTVKFLCPVPGYDRHFAICEAFGIDMIPIAMNEDGPNMDEVERLVADDSVKGIWCVPKYSNPGGVSYSDEVVRRLASMECAAADFRIFWDNAYAVHHLYDEPDMQDSVLDIAVACNEAGNPERYYKFASTSKVTIPGAGIAAMAASPANISEIKKLMNSQVIGYDKINQIRHVRFLKDAEGIAKQMRAHAAIIRPRFELVLKKLEEGLADSGCASWTKPRGGYFISFDGPEGTAKRIVGLAKDAGVVMTGAGSTWPYKNDPADSNIRIAPTLPPLDELDQAMEVFVCCVKIAALEKLLG